MESILESKKFSQPMVIKAILQIETSRVKFIADNQRKKCRYIVIAARGILKNAARYAQYLFGAQNRVQVALGTPSLFTVYEMPMEGLFRLAISIKL